MRYSRNRTSIVRPGDVVYYIPYKHKYKIAEPKECDFEVEKVKRFRSIEAYFIKKNDQKYQFTKSDIGITIFLTRQDALKQIHKNNRRIARKRG